MWFYYEESDGSNVVTFFSGGGFYFFFVTTYGVIFRINITITGGFFFKVVMAKGRRLRKSASGELEMSKENGTALDDAIFMPNVDV